MKTKLFILLFLPVLGLAQGRILKGQIKSDAFVSGVLVVNLTRQTEMITDGFGRFAIEAQVGDLLIFSASHLHRKRHLVENEDFDTEISIEMESKPIEIETVEIERFNITAESLGIIPKGTKRYTAAERRLLSATCASGFDAVINAITGRAKMLRKLVEMEKEDKRVAYLSNLFTEHFYTETLKIHPDNLTEFKFYALYNLEKNVSAQEKETYIQKLSKTELEIKLIPLAQNYLKLKEEG